MEHKTDRPTVEQIDREIRRRKRRSQTHRILRSTLFSLLTVAAAAVLVSTLFYVLGSLLVIAAGVYFVTKKRMDVEYMVNNAAPQAEP